MEEPEEGMQCPKCGRSVRDQDELDRHMSEEHPEG
ncbi:MAG TPA: C2H2-type zinc finger protein [Actinomycetota bacterium]|nr:C2H2-type zinc finger protein [Actinomycetota bacterium]